MIELNLVYATFVDPLLLSTRRAVLRAVPAGARVVDVAFGTGDLARILSAKASDVHGVELSADRVRYASKRAGPNLHFHEGDARSLPFDDQQFDLATISMALHEMPASYRPQVLRELMRVAPEALVVDYSAPQPGNPVALGVRAIERVAGLEHFQGFQSFLEEGGIHGLAARLDLRAVLVEELVAGCIGLWRVQAAS